MADTPSPPSPEILEKLRQLREELAQKAAQQAPKDANTLAWQQSNAFKRVYPRAEGGQVDMDRMRLELMNKGGQPKHHYPYAKAHEQARLNAIKMLGLHENNTAQDRAKAMGFDLETYHGTDAPDIESLDPEKTKIVKGVFSTTHPSTASRYAEDNKKRAGEKSAPNIIPLLLKSASHKGMSKFDINTINSQRERGDKGAYRPEMQTAVTFDPSHMRSRFAAFDPAREHETHLLAKRGGRVTHAHQLEIEERPL